ncbi:MAG TPA: SDR family oxidoreductase [Isosphaeraceae bacterium]|jgi:pteridine reductase|nr:SDR family oxidoreductase [Isosphaeraceae bacterium]
MADTRRPVALVTGSGRRRVGLAVAEALAGRGFAIALHYRTAAREAQDFVDHWAPLGVEAAAFGADLAVESEARGLVRWAIGRFGRLDVLVNCAAIWESKPLEEVSVDDVRRHFESNVLGTFVCGQEAGLAMVGQAEGGCIVNFGDWADARPYVGYSAYFATKGAIPTLTRCLAVELGTRNPRVRVNAILPGPAMLPVSLPEAERAEAIRGTLVGREGRPEDLAKAVLFLIENEFVTGTCLTVDGGRTIKSAEC